MQELPPASHEAQRHALELTRQTLQQSIHQIHDWLVNPSSGKENLTDLWGKDGPYGALLKLGTALIKVIEAEQSLWISEQESSTDAPNTPEPDAKEIIERYIKRRTSEVTHD